MKLQLKIAYSLTHAVPSTQNPLLMFIRSQLQYPVSRRPDYWGEDDCNSNNIICCMHFIWPHAMFFVYTVLFSLYNRKCALSSSLFRWRNWGWASWSHLPKISPVVSGQCSPPSFNCSVCVHKHCLILEPLEGGVWSRESKDVGICLCSVSDTNRHIVSFILTNTLQGQCQLSHLQRRN